MSKGRLTIAPKKPSANLAAVVVSTEFIGAVEACDERWMDFRLVMFFILTEQK